MAKAELKAQARALGVSDRGTVAALEARIEVAAKPYTIPELPNDTFSTAPFSTAPVQKSIVEPIVRQNRTSWHCPLCDNSNYHTMMQCGKCGAIKVGDEVHRG